jgi:hypothetical protein
MWPSTFHSTLPAGTMPFHTPALCVMAGTAEKIENAVKVLVQ